ncbi:MAG: NUDIX pyrophosphatase [Promethearchaeota archaeon]
MIERINVQVFLFTRNPEFKVLILKRTKEKGGFWQPISGGIEKGEKIYDTIKREVFEETGIQDIIRIFDLNYSFIFKAPISRKLMKDICFSVELDKISDVKLSNEHNEYKWCSEKEAKNLLNWKYNIIAFKKLLKQVKKSNLQN